MCGWSWKAAIRARIEGVSVPWGLGVKEGWMGDGEVLEGDMVGVDEALEVEMSR
jgi:hypothetical protein